MISITDSNFHDNQGAAISATPDFLRAGDPTNPLLSGNPFFRGNVLTNNDLNGLELRTDVFWGGRPSGSSRTNLHTDGLWDDTDLPHIVRGPIIARGASGYRTIVDPETVGFGLPEFPETNYFFAGQDVAKPTPTNPNSPKPAVARPGPTWVECHVSELDSH